MSRRRNAVFTKFDDGWHIVKEKFIDTIEKKLETRGTKKINFPNAAYMEIHDTVYEICTGRPNYSDDLHRMQNTVICDYLQRVVLPSVEEKRERLQGVQGVVVGKVKVKVDESSEVKADNSSGADGSTSTDDTSFNANNITNTAANANANANANNEKCIIEFLEEIQFRWNNHTIMRKHYGIFFGYLDRWYVKQQSLPTIKESVLHAFKEQVYQKLDLEGIILDTLLLFIDGDRDRRMKRAKARRNDSASCIANPSKNGIISSASASANASASASANKDNNNGDTSSDEDDDYDITETTNLIKSVIGMYKEMGGCLNELEGRLLKALPEYYNEKWKVDLIRDHSVEECAMELRETLDEEIHIFVTNCHLFNGDGVKMSEEIIGKWLWEYIIRASSLERAGNGNDNGNGTDNDGTSTNRDFLEKVIDVHEMMEINKCQLKLEFIRTSREYFSQLRLDWMTNKVIPISEYMIRAEKIIKDEIRRIRFYVRSPDWATEIFGAILEELVTKFLIEFLDGQPRADE